jgi:membrane protein required for colicin V production
MPYIAAMFIDVVALLAVGMALFKGYSKGLIMALFNTVSLIIGLAVAVKFSSLLAPWVEEKLDAGPQFTPVLSFALVYMAAILLIRILGKSLEKTIESVKMGFLNRAGGMALYLVLYLAVTSIFIFYLEKMGAIDANQIEQSYTYQWLRPWGPTLLDGLGKIIPLFKDMFKNLEDFFDELSVENTAGNFTKIQHVM